MRKIDAILSKEALAKYLCQPNEEDDSYDIWFEIKTLLKQHTIVVCDSLVDEYRSFFVSKGLGDLFDTFYISQMYNKKGQVKDIADKPTGDYSGAELIKAMLTCDELA